MWMMPAHSVPISEQPDYRPFCWFLNPIPHPVLFSHFLTVLTHWCSLGFRSEKLQICSICSCLFCVCFRDFICRIIWNVVLVHHIACLLFNNNLSMILKGPFYCQFNFRFRCLLISVHTYAFIVHIPCIDNHAKLRCADYWGTKTYIGKRLGDKATNCASLLRIHTAFSFRISTFGLHYVNTDGKWDSQRNQVLDFSSRILWNGLSFCEYASAKFEPWP